MGYLTLWGPTNNTFQEFSYLAQQPQENKIAATSANNDASAKASADESAIRYVRAGTMISAVLVTPINSDAPGPVMAQITSGPLDGARLLGTMKINEESVLIAFNQISKPGWPDTYPVSAIGMDLKSSTALATDVNHHYLQKYMGILAGSYMQGYGQGLQQQNSVTILDPNGNIIQNQGELDTAQIRKKAQGNVLSRIGQDIASATGKRETTIKVEGRNGQPYPIKILFMQNF